MRRLSGLHVTANDFTPASVRDRPRVERVFGAVGLFAVLMLSLSARVGFAEAPRLLFDRSDLDSLRQRIARPQLAPVWKGILADAEAYCTPASSRYADPDDSYGLPEKADRDRQSRRDAVLVHMIGRKLTERMEAIGFAYQVTGRQALGRHGAALLAATAEQYPAANPIVAKGFAGGRGDIMRGLAVGYDLLGDCLDDDQRRTVAAAGAAYLDLFVREFNDPKRWWYKVHNYNGVNGGAAGCLALALRDDYPDRVDAWLAECIKVVRRWLAAGFDEDGAYVEGVGYSGYGLSNVVLFAEALRCSGKGDLFDHPTFRRLPEFYALSLLPGENVYDARNDSGYRGMNVSFLKLAEACHSGLYKWLWERTGADTTFLRIVWDNDVAAIDPVAANVPTAKQFRGRGLCVWRTGWEKRDVMFSIEAGPFYRVTHNQADKGHFTLYGLGYRWATDPGYANEHTPNDRGQSLGHSLVLVDGVGQALSGAGWGTNGVIVHYANNDRYGYALADCTEAYNRNNQGMPGAVVEHARRHAIFVYPQGAAPAYAVVMDDIRKDDQPHEFKWQMMLADGMAATLDAGRAVFDPASASAGGYVDTPADSLSRGAHSANRSGACALDFRIDEPGEFVLWGRVRTLAETPGQGDSFFIRMDDGSRVAWHMPRTRKWTWGKIGSGIEHAPVGYKLDVGEHRLLVEMREPGAQIDCLALARDDQSVPSLSDADPGSLILEAEKGRLTGLMRGVPSQHSEARLVLRIHADAELSLTTDTFRPIDRHGPAAYPRFRATTRAVNPRYITVLLPLPSEVQEPEVTFSSSEGKRIAKVRWPGNTDTFVWSTDDGHVEVVERP